MFSIKRIIEELCLSIAGYRKPGIKLGGAISKRVSYGEVPRYDERDNNWIDLSANYHKDQGRVGACANVTLCAQIEDIIMSDTKDMMTEIKWKPVWDDMKSLGLGSDSGGSRLLDNLWYGKTVGVMDNYNQLWKLDIIEKINKDNIESFLRMGYQIYTGSICGSPMCDKNWLFRVGHKVFGHGFRIVGLDFSDLNNKRYLCETTWKRYGLKKSSQFYYPIEKASALMSCYVFTIKKVNE